MDSQTGEVWKFDSDSAAFVQVVKSKTPVRCYNPETKALEPCTPEWHKKYGKADDPIGNPLIRQKLT